MGDGVPRDYDRAIAWYLRAAERGNIKAQNNLRIMYSKGIGTERDPYKAALWSIKAAEGGHVESQVSLGQQYLKGNGVTKDLAKAYAWLVIAHKNGDQHWLNIISRLLLRLSLKHEDVEAARAYVVRHQKKEKS